MVFAFLFRPILQLVSCLTYAAWERIQTVVAQQAAARNSLHVILMLSVELKTAEDLQAPLALVFLVPARCVSSLCAFRTHKVSVVLTSILNRLPVPSACIEYFFARGAPVVVERQILVPVIVAFDTSLAS